MRTFNVFSNSKGKYKAVKSGWCWPAFFFGSIWSLFSGLWILAIIMLPVEIILTILNGILENNRITYDQQGKDLNDTIVATIAVVTIVIRLVFGIRGNKMRENRYKNNGYIYIDSVKSKSVKDAIESHKGK
ncbi:DUF2628 domain-containing protein [Parasphingorhabdus sp.]|uniref:DUF2628 domain-containing protein n=1 Tax=Parasphingorhabdus sp. TaxID=2709688 RepID=UPI003593CFB0